MNKEVVGCGGGSAPRYSVCVCNYNMADTIEMALASVLDQLSEEYEVLVVDDGSSDCSRQVLERMTVRYPQLRVIALPRDRNRTLGETRNFSIRQARGEYVILHIDADDKWEPFIKDFVEVFHRIELCLGREVLVKGWPIQIGRRDFLLRHGPYRNLSRGEDGDMWVRLAATDSYVHLKTYRKLMNRISRSKKNSRTKSIRDIWLALVSNFRLRAKPTESDFSRLLRIAFMDKYSRAPFKYRLLRLLLIVPACIASRFQQPLTLPENMRSEAQFLSYCDRTGGTYKEIMERHKCDGDLSYLREAARSIFEVREPQE